VYCLHMHIHKHHPDIIALGSHITELGWLLPEAGSTIELSRENCGLCCCGRYVDSNKKQFAEQVNLHPCVCVSSILDSQLAQKRSKTKK
jgi:hypothetical protein